MIRRVVCDAVLGGGSLRRRSCFAEGEVRAMVRYAMVAALAFGLTGATAAAQDEAAGQPQHGSKIQPTGPAAASGALHAHLLKSAREMQALPMTGDGDHDFVAAMRKHHQDGIEMARIALRSAKDAEARAFAQKVLDEQSRDVARMDAWLAQHEPATKRPVHGRRATPR